MIHLLHGYAINLSIRHNLLPLVRAWLGRADVAICHDSIGGVSAGLLLLEVAFQLDGVGKESSTEPLDEVVLLNPVERRIEEYAEGNKPQVPQFHDRNC